MLKAVRFVIMSHCSENSEIPWCYLSISVITSSNTKSVNVFASASFGVTGNSFNRIVSPPSQHDRVKPWNFIILSAEILRTKLPDAFSVWLIMVLCHTMRARSLRTDDELRLFTHTRHQLSGGCVSEWVGFNTCQSRHGHRHIFRSKSYV